MELSCDSMEQLEVSYFQLGFAQVLKEKYLKKHRSVSPLFQGSLRVKETWNMSP